MIDERINDDDLRRLLETAAADQPVPEDGVEKLLAARDRLEQPEPRRRGLPQWKARPAVRTWAPATALALVVLVGGVVAVGARSDTSSSSSGSSSGSASSSRAAPSSAPAPFAATAPAPAGPASKGPVPTGTLRTPAAEPRIVRTGSVSLSIAGQSGPVLDRLGGVAKGLGGYVAASSSQSASGGGNATVTLRVPAGTFDQALSQVSGLGQVTRSTTDAQDVTGAYVDLGARIDALQQTRATYTAILAKAGTIDETLAVQQQITDVQTQIEQLQGQQQVLADRSDLATLTVDVVDPSGTTAPKASPSGFSGAWHRAVDGFASGLQWLLAASGPVLLVVLIGAVLFWPGRRLVRVLRRGLI